MRKLLKFLLVLAALMALGAWLLQKNSALLISKIPGLEVRQASLGLKPLMLELKDLDYQREGICVSASVIRCQARIGRLSGLLKNPEDLRLDLFLSGVKARLSGGKQKIEEAEKEETRTDWEKLSRPPFLFSLQFEDCLVQSEILDGEIKASGLFGNLYRGSEHSLTGRIDVLFGKGDFENFSAAKFHGGIIGDCLKGSLTTTLRPGVLDFARLKADSFCFPKIDLETRAQSRLDWGLLRNAALSELPCALTGSTFKSSLLIPSLQALEGKLALSNLVLSMKADSESFWRQKNNYGTLSAWLFHAFKGGFDCKCREITLTNMAPALLTFKHLEGAAYSKPSGIIVSNLYFETMHGEFQGTAEASSRKVKGEEAYLPYIALDLHTMHFDAGFFCDAFNLYDNRMDGLLSGQIKTELFGPYVKKLEGKLYAGGKGTFTLKKAEDYLAGMKEGISKDLAGVLAGRLKKYPYKNALVELSYENKVTTVSFDLEGENDSSRIKLPIHLHSSWIDLLELSKQFKQ